MPHDLILLKTAEKEIEKLIDKNKEVDDLLKIKFVALQNIDISEALKSHVVDTVKGISPKVLSRLKEKHYEPCIYEYRAFPKTHPYRILFISKESAFIILMVIHHKEMQAKFNEFLSKRLYLILHE